MYETLLGVGLGILGVAGFVGYKLIKGKDVESDKEKYIPTTQDHLPFDYIRGGIVKLKSGGYRLLIELPSVNIQLMADEEQEMVLQRYRGILNSMEFPFQYLQQSRVVDVSDYIGTLQAKIKKEKNTLLQHQLEEYSSFLEELIRERSILTKKFYLVIPFDETKESKEKDPVYKQQYKQKDKSKNKKGEKDALPNNDDIFEEEKRFEKAKKALYGRGAMVDRAFRKFEISPTILQDQDLLELFYTAYNKDRSVVQSLRTQKIEDFMSIRVTDKKEGRE